VRILNSAGGTFTSRARAIKYLASGRARYVDEHTIRMIESHPGHLACIASARHDGEQSLSQGPTVEIVADRPATPRLKVLVPLGYLHYPQRVQTTGGRLRRVV
jgi:hypothetical protein